MEMYNYKVKKGNKYQLKKIFVALAGPVTNIVLAMIFYKNKEILYSNALIAVFNLLPIYPLDGGRIVKGILHILFGNWNAKKYINSISMISITIITLVLGGASYYFGNISIVFVIVYLWVLVINERIKYQNELNIYNLVKSIENN